MFVSSAIGLKVYGGAGIGNDPAFLRRRTPPPISWVFF
nr:MAG TPA: hypothetical protein [Caudoviricetes sp.]